MLRTLTTNDVGQYVAPGLPIGTYDLKAEASGFKLEETKGIVLNVNDRIRVDFQMKMGTKAETVSVESNAIASAVRQQRSKFVVERYADVGTGDKRPKYLHLCDFNARRGEPDAIVPGADVGGRQRQHEL